MAATASPRVAPPATRPRAGFDRWALAAITPIGPLAIAILRGILPYKTTDSNTTLAVQVAAHQGAESLVVWLTFIAMLTLIPGIIVVGLLARRGSHRLGTIGLVLAFAAFMSLFWFDQKLIFAPLWADARRHVRGAAAANGTAPAGVPGKCTGAAFGCSKTASYGRWR